VCGPRSSLKGKASRELEDDWNDQVAQCLQSLAAASWALMLCILMVFVKSL
jgi:hypothetical protein